MSTSRGMRRGFLWIVVLIAMATVPIGALASPPPGVGNEHLPPGIQHSANPHGDRDGDADGNPATSYTEDNDSDGVPNNLPDEEDNEHPSGNDRSVEPGGSGNQGQSESVPDQNGTGPERDQGGTDKPNGPGGGDIEDQDGNNGCGNDDDFDDDNEGWCGKPRPAGTPPPPPPSPPPTGSLRIHKTVEGEGDPTSFTFDIDCDGTTWDRENVHVSPNGQLNLHGIPVGTTCTVTEDDPGPGWATRPADRTRIVVIPEGDLPGIARFVNTRQTGSLRIDKTVAGGGDPTAFTFDIDCEGTAWDRTDVGVDAGGSYTLAGIPVGTSCTVKEDDPGVGWTTIPASREVDLTITEGGNVAAFANTKVAVASIVSAPAPPTQTAVLGAVFEAAPIQPEVPTEVLGVQILRIALPQTGMPAGSIGALGLLLAGTGVAMVHGSRRQRAG